MLSELRLDQQLHKSDDVDRFVDCDFLKDLGLWEIVAGMFKE
jgi:hypothetical protein